MENNADAIIFIQGNLPVIYILCISSGNRLPAKSYKTVLNIEKRQLA